MPTHDLRSFSTAEPLDKPLRNDHVLVWAHNLGIGDFINALPLFPVLRESASRLDLATNPGYHLLVTDESLFDHFSSEFTPPPCECYDLLVEIVSHPSKFKRAFVDAKRHLAFSTMGERSPMSFIYRFLQQQFRTAGFSIDDTVPSLDLTDKDMEWADRGLERYGLGEASEHLRIGIHPGAGFKPKLWTISGFAGLADRLHAAYEARIALFAGPGDVDRIDRIVARMDSDPATVIWDQNLRGVAAIMSRMDVFISCDSGLMHMAAALDIPLVSIFGPTHPRSWGPFNEDGIVVFARPPECGSCGYARASQCRDRKCLEDISVETVLAHVDRAVRLAALRDRGAACPYVWNNQDLEHFASPDLRRRAALGDDVSVICRTSGPSTREVLAERLRGSRTNKTEDPRALVDAMCEARLLIPSWYARARGKTRNRPLPMPSRRACTAGGPDATRHLVFSAARETDASELLTLILNLPSTWTASVLVSQRHPLMGTIMERHAIPYHSYESTDDFYAMCEHLKPDAIVWASYANIGRYAPEFRHVFVDHGMLSKGHFMGSTRMGDYNLDDYAMVCVPNRVKYDRIRELGYAGRTVLTGYLKGDMYKSGAEYPRGEILEHLGLDESRPLVLYCPTNIGWIGTGTLEESFEMVLEGAGCAGANLLIKPHEEDYVRFPGLLDSIRKRCEPGQVIILDWESPIWISIADRFVGDSSSANIETMMCGTATALLPAAPARQIPGSDRQMADLHQELIHSAFPTMTSSRQLTEWIMNPPPDAPGNGLLKYFNEYFDGSVHTRFFEALDDLLVQ